MAQLIKIKSGSSGAAPGSLLTGEPAYSINDNKLYIGNGSSVVRVDAGSYTAECSTAAATGAKTVSCAGFILFPGVEITVKFTVTNTAAVSELTLNVGGTGAKPIRYRGTNLLSPSTLSANRVYKFYYGGDYWELIGDLDTDTTVATELALHTGDTDNPHSVTKAQVGLGDVENTALSTWAGSTAITTLGTITTGTWNATTIAVAKGGTGKTTVTANAMLYASEANTYAEVTTSAFGRGLLNTASGVTVTGLYASASEGVRQNRQSHSGTIGSVKDALVSQMTSAGSNTGSAVTVNGSISLFAANWSNDATEVPASSLSTFIRLDDYHNTTYGQWLASAFGSNDIYLVGRSGSAWTLFSKIYTSGNTNTTTVDWSAKNLTLAGTITGATTITASSTIQATTAKLTNLSDGYLPYHVSDASGLANSPIYTDGTKVGIGTTNPGAKLEVAGNALINGGTLIINNNAGLYQQVGGTYKAYVGYDTSTLKVHLYNFVSGQSLGLLDNGVLTYGGNVGIGTTDPLGYKLYVSGTGHYTSNLSVGGDVNVSATSIYLYDGVQALKLAKGTDTFYANTFVGYNAGNSSAYRQTALGYHAGYSNTGTQQTAVGYHAGYSNTGNYQTAVGYYAGYSNSGAHQTAVGYHAGYSNTGANQTALGCYAGYSNTGNYQTAVGYHAGYSNTGNYQTAVGHAAGHLNTGTQQTAVGYAAGYSNTGTAQTAVGYYAGYLNTGTAQTAVGYYAGYSNAGDRVIGIGYEATRGNTATADDVVAIGYQAGKDNTIANLFILKQTNINAVPLIQGNFSSGNVSIGSTDTSTYKLYVSGTGHYTSNLSVGGTLGVTGASTLSSARITSAIYFGSSGTDYQINSSGSAKLYDTWVYNLSVKHATPFIDFYFGNGSTVTSRIIEQATGVLDVIGSVKIPDSKYLQIGNAKFTYETVGGVGFLKLAHSDTETPMHLVTTGGQTMYSTGVPASGDGGGSGTLVYLNGSLIASETAYIYAPTTAGSSNNILKSNGSGEPSWVNITSLIPWGGSGSSTMVSRSDHNHGGVYAAASHGHATLFYTELLYTDSYSDTHNVLGYSGTSNYDITLGNDTYKTIINGSPIVLDPFITYTGFVKCTNGTLSIDSNTYLPLSGGTVTGSLSVNTLSITNDSGVSHLAFGRGSYNYITMPVSGLLGILPNGQGVGATNGMWFSSSGLHPGTNNTFSVGTNGMRFAEVHATTIYEAGTELSSKYAASSHTHSGYASTSHDHSGVYATASHTHSYVPTTRKINNQALSSDITLSHTDVGAAAASHTHSGYALTSHNHYSIGDDSTALLLTGTTVTICTDLSPSAGFWKSSSSGELYVDTNTYLTGITKTMVDDVSCNADTVDSLHASSFLRSDAANSSDIAWGSTSGRGIRFWNDEKYKIFMAATDNTTYGNRMSGDTKSDYNMYFRIGDGTNRGFVFESSYSVKLASINPDGIRTLVPLTVRSTETSYNNSQITLGNAAIKYLSASDDIEINKGLKFTAGTIQGAVIDNYGVCSTAASTGAKTVTIGGFRLATGVQINVKFSNNNSAYPLTLNVSNTGAKTVKAYGDNDEQYFLEQIQAGAIVPFVYDGTYWVIPTTPSMY